MASIVDIRATIKNFASSDLGLREADSGSVDTHLGWFGFVTVDPQHLNDPRVQVLMTPAIAALTATEQADALVGLWLVHDHKDGYRATRWATRPARLNAWNALQHANGVTEVIA